MNYKIHTQKNSKKLGPPIFATMVVVFIVGLFLSYMLDMFIGSSYKKAPDGFIYRPKELKKSGSAIMPLEAKYEQKDAQSLHLRAKALIKEKNYKEAEIYAEKSLQAKSNFYRAYIDLGAVYTSNGDYLKAEKVFKKAMEFIGNDTFDLEIIYADLGLIYLVERRFNEAWEYLRKAYERKTYLGDNFWADARLKYVIENNKVKFIEQKENDKRLPREIGQRRKQVEALVGRNNGEAIRNCEQYLSDNPDSAYTYVFRSFLVSALFRSGEYEKAYEQLKIVESENLPENYIPWVKFMYAYLYKEKGQRQKAARYLKDIIVNYPYYESIGQAKEMLTRIEE